MTAFNWAKLANLKLKKIATGIDGFNHSVACNRQAALFLFFVACS
jgi:hypothetical protein